MVGGTVLFTFNEQASGLDIDPAGAIVGTIVHEDARGNFTICGVIPRAGNALPFTCVIPSAALRKAGAVTISTETQSPSSAGKTQAAPEGGETSYETQGEGKSQ